MCCKCCECKSFLITYRLLAYNKFFDLLNLRYMIFISLELTLTDALINAYQHLSGDVLTIVHTCREWQFSLLKDETLQLVTLMSPQGQIQGQCANVWLFFRDGLAGTELTISSGTTRVFLWIVGSVRKLYSHSYLSCINYQPFQSSMFNCPEVYKIHIMPWRGFFIITKVIYLPCASQWDTSGDHWNILMN